jgi:hypothetical protein
MMRPDVKVEKVYLYPKPVDSSDELASQVKTSASKGISLNIESS